MIETKVTDYVLFVRCKYPPDPIVHVFGKGPVNGKGTYSNV